MCSCTASHGWRRRAPISGGPSGSAPLVGDVVKRLDLLPAAMYRQVTLPTEPGRRKMITASTPEQIEVGEMTIRFLLEGEQADGSVAVIEFDVPARSRVAAPHSHDGDEETIYGPAGTPVRTLAGAPPKAGTVEVL